MYKGTGDRDIHCETLKLIKLRSNGESNFPDNNPFK